MHEGVQGQRRRRTPEFWTRTSFLAFAGLSGFLLLVGSYFLAAQFAPQTQVVVRGCVHGAQQPAPTQGQHCTVMFRHDGVAELVDLETDASYPRGRALTVHVTGHGALVQDSQANGGLLFLPLGALPVVLLLRWGWPPSAAARAAALATGVA